MKRERDDNDKKLTKLALRLSSFIDGEDLLDIATVCARVIAFSINQSYDSDEAKFKTLNALIEFMRRDLQTMCDEMGEPNGQSQRTN